MAFEEKMKYSAKQIECFLNCADHLFFMPLSSKQDLHSYACKLHELATICAEVDQGKIVAMVAGYTDNLVDNTAYISAVATLELFQRQGLAFRLVREFIDICKEKNIKAVHLYTAKNNVASLALYKKIGFKDYLSSVETQVETRHLIYYI